MHVDHSGSSCWEKFGQNGGDDLRVEFIRLTSQTPGFVVGSFDCKRLNPDVSVNNVHDQVSESSVLQYKATAKALCMCTR
jgi:hypothetical protein